MVRPVMSESEEAGSQVEGFIHVGLEPDPFRDPEDTYYFFDEGHDILLEDDIPSYQIEDAVISRSFLDNSWNTSYPPMAIHEPALRGFDESYTKFFGDLRRMQPAPLVGYGATSKTELRAFREVGKDWVEGYEVSSVFRLVCS
ncbi:hypothetical protein RRF57_006972 [Xylaria bambusicola]|uniref:Uncharacterized protein n=1 Tax=Xylaria bambusicola TaxID=326684 RepID=A0AAN7UK59_9PEZI